MSVRNLAWFGPLLLLPGLAHAQTPGATFDVSLVNVWSSGAINRVVGWEFSVTSTITVNALGVFDAALSQTGPGLGADHELGLYELGGTFLASATLPANSSAAMLDDYVYASIVPLTLNAGQNYVVAATWPSMPYDWSASPSPSWPLSYDSRLDFVQSRYELNATILNFPIATSALEWTPLMVNFLIVESIGTSYCIATSNSSGAVAVLTATGSVVAASNDVTLHVSQLPPNQFGYLLTSQIQGFIPTPGNSRGNLCLALPIGRYLASLANAGPNGQFSFTLDLPNTPTNLQPVAVVAGETWHFQAWYRDMNPTPTSNFSEGLSIAFQ